MKSARNKLAASLGVVGCLAIAAGGASAGPNTSPVQQVEGRADSTEREANTTQSMLEELVRRRRMMLSAPASNDQSEADRAESIALVDRMLISVLSGTRPVGSGTTE